MEEQKPASEVCVVCGQAGANKKFGGQHYHKPCLRAMRKQAKKMMR
jgi:hypothetical protein